MTLLPTVLDIKDAAHRIAGAVKTTPLLSSSTLDALTGGRILLKAECLQDTGSFKLRGATNRIAHLSEVERAAGVVAWSSGNHAQGVAAAAKRFRTSAKIVMPSDAPRAKLDATRALDAEVILYDRVTENREEIGKRIAAEEGRVIVPPYDDPHIIAGQGTVGLELADQSIELGLALDDALTPASGGGLIAGVGLAIKDAFPKARIYVVEPEGFEDHGRSLASGRRVKNETVAGSICDALMAPTPGDITWQINQKNLSGAYAVNDDTVLDAMAFAHRELGLRLEPGGAAALAALLSGHHETKGRTVALILSGSNVDDALFNRALARQSRVV